MYERNNVYMGRDAIRIADEPLPTDSPSRSLYSGDISTSIQQRFADTIARDVNSMFDIVSSSYYLVRSDSGEYRCYFGDIDRNGTIHSAKMYRYYQVSTGGYNTAWEWSESELSGGVVDLDGRSGFIYSSYSGYPAAAGFSEYKDSAIANIFSLCILSLLMIVSLGVLIGRWLDVRASDKS